MKTNRRVSFLCLCAAAMFLWACGSNVKRVVIGTKDEVRYSGTATEQDASALGNVLKRSGMFADRGTSVTLSKRSDGTSISWVVSEGMWNDPNYAAQLEQVTRNLSPVVGGLPIKVKMCNLKYETKKEWVVHPPVMVGAKDFVVYQGDATEKDAKALGDALKNAGYFQDLGSQVVLLKGGDGTVISFVVEEGLWNNEEKIEGFQTMMHDIAPQIGEGQIKVRLVNTDIETKKEFPVS